MRDNIEGDEEAFALVAYCCVINYLGGARIVERGQGWRYTLGELGRTPSGILAFFLSERHSHIPLSYVLELWDLGLSIWLHLHNQVSEVRIRVIVLS